MIPGRIKFGQKVREANREYERNYNCEVDNGIKCGAYEEQQQEEAKLFQSSESDRTLDSLEEECLNEDTSCDETYLGQLQLKPAAQKALDHAVVNEICQRFGTTPAAVKENSRKCNYVCATYHLLVQKGRLQRQGLI